MIDRAALLAIVLLALVLRLIGLRYGLPAVYNPDEVAIMSRALAFATGDLNPHNFLYPTFYFYALAAWIGVTGLWAIVTGAVADLAAFQREFFIDPTRVYTAGRLLTAICGVATAVGTWALARRTVGVYAAFAAALFLAVAPLHVRDSHYVKHDVPATLLIVLAYIACWRAWRAATDQRGTTPALIVAALVTGIAFSTHYYTIFLALPLAWAATRHARDWRDAARRLALAAGISAGMFFVLSPFILVEPATAWRDIRANRAIVIDRAIGELGYSQTAWHYVRMLWSDTVGWPIALLALGGIAIELRRRPAQAAWLLAFPLPFALFIASTFPASRYLVPILPFIVLFAGAAVASVANHRRSIAAAVAILAAAPGLLASVRAGQFFRQDDTRTLAKRYVEHTVPAGSTVAIQPYSVPLTPSRDGLVESLTYHLGSAQAASTKFRMQLGLDPYPSPAYRLIWLGRGGLDVDKIYVDPADGTAPLRRLGVEFVILKRYNEADPEAMPFLAALAREGRRIAAFTPYRPGLTQAEQARVDPFLHNTDTRISGALERPGPPLEIWHIHGPGS